MVASWVYGAFGIERPTIAAKELNTRVSLWQTTIEALSAAGTSMDEIVQGLTAVNEGPGANEFAEFMAGTSASPDAIGKAKGDAGEFAAACAAAAQKLTDTVTAMDAATDIVDARIKMANLIPGLIKVDKYAFAQAKCKDIEEKMLDLQESAVKEIEGIFSFAVDIPSDPPPLAVDIPVDN